MQFFTLSRLVIASLAAWGLACILAFFGSTDLAFEFAYFVLPFSAYLVPILVSLLAVDVYIKYSGASDKSLSSALQIAISVSLACVSYIVCVVVLARLLEIPWRQAKFADPVLSFGGSSAGVFALVVALLMSLSLFVFRYVPRRSKAAFVIVSSLAMLGFSSLAYLVVGLSPLVEWRT